MGEAKRKSEALAVGLIESCGSCRFFRRLQVGQAGGVCRAWPPVPMVAGIMKHPTTGETFPRVNTYWPEIPDSEWCGAYEKRAHGAGIDLGKLDIEELEGEA